MRRGLASIPPPPATTARSARAPAARGSLRRRGRDASRDDDRHVPDARPPRPQDVAGAALRLTAIAWPRPPQRREGDERAFVRGTAGDRRGRELRRQVVEYQVRQTLEGADVLLRANQPVDVQHLARALEVELNRVGCSHPLVTVRTVTGIPRTGVGKLRRFLPSPAEGD